MGEGSRLAIAGLLVHNGLRKGGDTKKALIGSSSAAATCCKVLTLGEVLPFSIRLRVLTLSPLCSAKARMERPRSVAARASGGQHLPRRRLGWR